MGLDQPLRSTGLAYPDGGGVVVVALALRIVFCAAVDGVDDVVGSERGVRREDADLDVAEFVGLELAMLEGDHKGVDGLDAIVDLDEVFGEEAPDSREVTLGHGGPEMPFQVDDFYRSGGCECLSEGGSGDGKEKEEKETHGNYVSV